MASPSLENAGYAALRSELPEEEADEVLRQLMAENVDNLDLFQELMNELAANKGDLSRVVAVNHKAVSIDTFIDDPYFLKQGEFVYPEVRKAIKQCIDGGYIQFLAMGAIGRGKTTAAQIVTAYHIYLLSLEKYPQARFGLMPTSSIVFAMLNKTSDLARDVTFGEFFQLMEPVPYFREHFPFDPSIKSRMEFPNRIRVEYAAAYASKLLGKNVIGGITDEMNFMSRIEKSKQSVDGGEFNQAKKIHSSLVRRRKSRFLKKGKLPGCLCVVSSAGYPGDFTDQLKAQVEAEDDGLTYVWEGPQWEVVPADRFSGERFLLELGDERHDSVILNDRAEARSGAEIIEVPVEYRADFLDDMNEAIRDILGRNIAGDRPYFWDRKRVWAMADRNKILGYTSPFTVDSTDLSSGFPDLNEEWDAIPYPQRPRAMHIDLAQGRAGGDAAGIAMGYVWKTDHAKSRLADNPKSFSIEEVPLVRFDFTLQIKAPKNGEIEFSDIREFIYWVRDELGYPVKYVTFDGFQSVDSRQILKKAGFITELVSVEGTEAYEALRTGIWQERVDCPLNKIAFGEIAGLQENRKLKKVDHKPDGSKDVSDGMAGVYKTLVQRRESWQPSPLQGVAPVRDQFGTIVGAKPLPTTVRRNPVRRNMDRR